MPTVTDDPRQLNPASYAASEPDEPAEASPAETAPAPAPQAPSLPDAADEPTRRPLPPRLAAMNPASADDFVAQHGYDPSQFSDPQARAPYEPVIKQIETNRSNAAQIATWNEAEDTRLAGAQAKQAKKDANTSREAYYRTHGIRTYIDANGDQVPQLDESGNPSFHPRKWPVEYDSQGNAIQRSRDEAGNVTTNALDVNADYGTHKDAPGRLFKQNQNAPWQDVGSIDDNLANDNPAIAAAAGKAKKARDAELAKQATQGFKIAGDQVDAQARDASMAWQRDVAPRFAQIDAQIEAKRADPQYNATGWFGSQTDPAKQLHADVDKLTAEQSALPPSPDTPDNQKLLKAKKAGLRNDGHAFDALIEQHGGDVNAAAQQFRDQITQAGGDPDAHPAMAHLERAKKELGMPTFAEQQGATKTELDDSLRQLPQLAPQFAARDAAAQAGDAPKAEAAQAQIDATKDKAIADHAGLRENAWNAMKVAVRTAYGIGAKSLRSIIFGDSDRSDYSGYTPAQLDAEEAKIKAGTAYQIGDDPAASQRLAGIARERQRATTGDFIADPEVWRQFVSPDSLREQFGTDPALDKTKLGKVGEVVGGIAAYTAAGPAALPMMMLNSASDGRDAAEDQARAEGETDPQKIRRIGDAAASKAETWTALTLPIYMAGGKLATEATKALLPEANAAARAALGFVLSGSANTVASGTVRKLEGAVDGTPAHFWPQEASEIYGDWGWAGVHARGEFNTVRHAQAVLDGTHPVAKNFAEMAADESLPPEVRQQADDALMTFQDAAVNVLGGKERIAAQEKLRTERTAKATSAIDNLDPANPQLAGLPPQQVEDTKNVARALVKIATGQPTEALTTAEATALAAPAPDGLPRVDEVKGKPVITQGAIDRLKGLVPEAGAVIRNTEADQRAEMIAPKPAKSDTSEKAAKPAKVPKPPKPSPKAVQHMAEADVTHALATQMQAGAERDLARKLHPIETQQVREAASIWAPAWAKHQQFFDEIHTTMGDQRSGGVGSLGPRKLAMSVHDSVMAGTNYQELKAHPEIAMARMREEAIHSLVRSAITDEDAAGIWGDLPMDVQRYTRKAYGNRSIRDRSKDTAAHPDALNLGHEYLRMVIENKLGVPASETTSPKLMARLRRVLSLIANHFKNLRDDLLKGGASAETVKLVEDTRDQVAAAYQKLTGDKTTAKQYEDGHEPATARHTGADIESVGEKPSTAGTAGESHGDGGNAAQGGAGNSSVEANPEMGAGESGGPSATGERAGGAGGAESDTDANLAGAAGEPESGAGQAGGELKSLVERATEVMRKEGKVSSNLLQRRLRLGYSNTQEVLAEMEKRGLIGPDKGNGQRDVLAQAETPAPKSGASQATIDAAKKAFGDILSQRAGDLVLRSQTPDDFSARAPNEKRTAFLDLADKMAADGIKTPEGVARFLEETLGGKARKYSQYLWDTLYTGGHVPHGTPDWKGIYDKLSMPAEQAAPVPEHNIEDPETYYKHTVAKHSWLAPVMHAMRDLDPETQKRLLRYNNAATVPKTPAELAGKIDDAQAAYKADLDKAVEKYGPTYEEYKAEFTPEVRTAFDGRVAKIADAVGARPMIGVDLKGPRAIEKAWNDVQGTDFEPDVTSIKDVLRASIIAHDDDGVTRAVEAVKAEFGVDPNDPTTGKQKDRFAKPQDGYKDHLFQVRLPNGRFAEIQVHRADMIFAKEAGPGHKIYELLRTVLGVIRRTPEGERPPLQAWADQLAATSTTFYAGSEETYRGNLLNSSKESGSPSSEIREGQYGSGGAVAQDKARPSGSKTAGNPLTEKNSVPGGKPVGSELTLGSALTTTDIQKPGAIVTGKEAADTIQAGGVGNVAKDDLAATFRDMATMPGPINIAGRLFVDGKDIFGGGLGIARGDMPQVPKGYKPKFYDELRAKGVKVKDANIIPTKLHPTQDELDGVGIGKMLDTFDPEQVRKAPLVVSKDNYVLDGHHRWAVWIAKHLGALPITRVDLPMSELLEGARLFNAANKIPARELGDSRRSAEKPTEAPAAEPPKEPTIHERKAVASSKIAAEVAESLEAGKSIKWPELFAMGDRHFEGTQGDGAYTPKDAYDAMELGINRWIGSDKEREKFNPAQRDESEDVDRSRALDAVRALKEMLKLVPTQSKRTAETDEFQQFSTVPPLAYMANWVAAPRKGEVMVEPSAGIGGLAIFAKNAGAEVVTNELSPRRAAVLDKLGLGRGFTENAEQINNVLPDDIKPSLVVMNPPFSATAGRMQGVRDTSNATRHIEQALARLAPGGRLVAIVGEGMAHDRPTFKGWWKKMGQQYDVRANIGVNGAEYAKYGTTFDNQLFVIDKPGPEGKTVTNEPVTGKVDKIEELIPLLESIRHDRPQSIGKSENELGGAERPGGDIQPAPGDDVDRAPGDGLGGVAEPEQPGMDGVDRGGERPAGGGETPDGLDQRQGAGAGEGGRVSGGGGTAGLPADEPLERAEVSTVAAVRDRALTNSIYDSYQPSVRIPGTTMPPVKVQESAAMASVEPITPTYRPAIPKEYYQPQGDAKEGRLSALAMEAITLAGNAHQDFVPLAYTDDDRAAHLREHGEEPPDKARRGFFIGDGTGMGKGRQVAGAMLDNWMQGRKKHIWITEKPKLIHDAKRDLDDVSGMSNHIFELGKTKLGEDVPRPDGIAFTTYATLRSAEKNPKEGVKPQTRADQIVKWAGKDFDGVLAFDEAHNMANNTPQKGKRGFTKPSAQALTAIELQRRLPKARVIYLSATGATEVSNLGYAERLGLWGPGTPFANKNAFINDVSSGGVAAMELVARDLKSLGMYVSRAISWDGVTYGKTEHTLSPEQRGIYDALADGWQNVLGEMHKALEAVGATGTDDETGKDKTMNKGAKSAALSAFWGSHQRFFNQVITAMKMPSVLRASDAALKEGKAVVMQLVNTNEASQARAIEKRRAEAADSGDATDFEDLDLTPRDILMQMVENSFPVTQQESFTDENGAVRSRPAKDSQGNPIINKEAVAMREALLDKLGSIRVPDGPLEMLLNHYGADQVSEITGRTQRIESVKDEAGNMVRRPVRRSVSNRLREEQEFNDDVRKVLVFSNAGGTGSSYHADLRFKNQRERFHVLVQPGWQAAQAVQGFGRTHRNNEAQPPHYELASTDIAGEKRFMSSIARRLDQLGALTKGQRQTGSQGLFKASDNLESDEAKAALTQFYREVLAGRIEDIPPDVLEKQMGMKMRDDEGNVKQELPPITSFLNRLLSLKLDLQQKVFDAFSQRMERIVEAAKTNGTLDQGMENLTALHTKIAEEKVINTDERTGAETRYVKLDTEQPNERSGFHPGAPAYYINQRSGSVWAEGYTHSTTDTKTGDIIDRTGLHGVTRHQVIDTAKLRDPDRWKKADEAEAHEEWRKQFDETPATRKETVHFITGTILPVWDRVNVATGAMRVMRAQTDDGKRMIGLVIRPSEINEVMGNFGNEQEIPPPDKLAGILLNGGEARMGNGWRFKRSRVSGEKRIELIGPGYYDQAELDTAGVFRERINFDTRYFVPVDKAAEVIEKLTKNRPVVEVQGDDAQEAVHSQRPPDDRDQVDFPFRDGANASERIKNNFPLVEQMVRKFSNIQGKDKAEIRGRARVALVKAAQGFDPDSGHTFNAYARKAMHNALSDLYRQERDYRANELQTLNRPVPGKEDAHEDSIANLPDAASDVRRDVSRSDARDVLGATIATLPDRLRIAARGLLDGRSLADIGRDLGSESPRPEQVASNVAKIAYGRLRSALAARGIHSADDMLVRSQRPPDEPGAKGFDPYAAIRSLQEAARAEKPGERTIGRPDLALGASDPQAMGVDEWRKGLVQPETREQWSAEADRLLRDPDKLQNEIIASGVTPGGKLSAAQTVAAKRLVAQRMREAFKSGNVEARNDAAFLVNAYRETGRRAGQDLAARYDENMTPEDRHREFFGRMIFTPPPKVQAEIDAAPTAAARKKLLTDDQTRVAKIERELAKMGVSLDEIMAGEVKMRLKPAKFVESATAGFAAKEKEAMRMVQANRSWKDIAKHTALTRAQVEDAQTRLRDEFLRRHLAKFEAGAEPDMIDPDLLHAQSSAPAPKVSREEAMAKALQAFKMMGFDRGDAQGKKPFDLKDPVQVVKVARTIQAADSGAFSMAYEAWINNILSGPATHIANIAGNLANTAWDFTVQRGMETFVNAMIHHDPHAAQLGEFGEIAKGLMPGLSRGIRLAAQTWDAEHDLFRHQVLGEPIDLHELSDKGGSSHGAIPGLTGRVVRVPGRALMAADAFFKMFIGQMQAGAEAFRIAKAEGLTGDARAKRIQQLVDNVGQEHPEAWQAAVEKATDLTFQQELKDWKHGGNTVESIAAWVQKGRNEVKPLGLVVPFVKTPFNIFRQGLRKSPLGALNLVSRFAKAGFYKLKDGKAVGESYVPADQVKHVAEQMLAWATAALLYGAVQGDQDDDDKKLLITGSMPGTETRRGERDLQKRAYGGDYTVRIGGRNGVVIHYGRFEPFATVLGTTVDTIRQLKNGNPAADKLDGMIGYFLAQAQSKTFVQGIADFISAMQDPENKAGTLGKSFLSTLVPNLIRQPLRNLDDYVRDSGHAPLAYSLVPAPGNAEKKTDVYGHDVEKAGSPLSRLFFTAPTKPYPELEQADRMLLEWNRVNPAEKWAPEPLGRKFTSGGKTIELTPEEYRRTSEEAGAKVRALLRGKLTAAQIARPKAADLKMVKAAFEKGRDEARDAARLRLHAPKKGQATQDIRSLMWRS